MKKYLKKTAWALLLAFAGGFGLASAEADIVLTGGGADINWFYESGGDPNEPGTWHNVFRNKGSTQATGLSTQFADFTGSVGHGDDWEFDTLTVNLSLFTQLDVGGTDFYISSANGSPFLADGSTADLGIRTRLREDEVALGIGTNTVANQFDNFRLSLNLSESTYNGQALGTSGAEFAVISWDDFDNQDVLINTDANDLSHDFPNWGHTHYNYGFTELGEYSLVFDFEGVGGTYGDIAPAGESTLNFDVVPEPSTAALVLLGLGFGGLLRKQRLAKLG